MKGDSVDSQVKKAVQAYFNVGLLERKAEKLCERLSEFVCDFDDEQMSRYVIETNRLDAQLAGRDR